MVENKTVGADSISARPAPVRQHLLFIIFYLLFAIDNI